MSPANSPLLNEVLLLFMSLKCNFLGFCLPVLHVKLNASSNSETKDPMVRGQKKHFSFCTQLDTNHRHLFSPVYFSCKCFESSDSPL